MLPTAYAPISSLARQFAHLGSEIESEDIVLVGHEPNQGRFVYAVTLFPGLPVEAIDTYSALHDVSFPEVFKSFLRHINGAFLCELDIFGIPPSMLLKPPKLSRSTRNPFDVGTANKIWIAEYRTENQLGFHFGSRNIGWSQQIGYFLRDDGSVLSQSKDGSDSLRRRWSSFDEWLRDEIVNVLRDRPDYLDQVQRESRKANRPYLMQRMLPWNWHQWGNS